MTVVFDLPPEAEQALGRQGGDTNLAAREAVLVELYRRGLLTHYQLAQALKLSRFQTDALLRNHGVKEDLLTVEEFRRDTESLSPRE